MILARPSGTMILLSALGTPTLLSKTQMKATNGDSCCSGGVNETFMAIIVAVIMSTCSPAGMKMREGDTGGGGRRGRSDLGVESLRSSLTATPAGTSSCCQCPERDQERVGEM